MAETAITIIGKSIMSINTITNDQDNTKFILLVDDEKDILELYTEYLSSNGLKIISFADPNEALIFLNANSNNCSIVITDYSMSQMTGLDLSSLLELLMYIFLLKLYLLLTY